MRLAQRALELLVLDVCDPEPGREPCRPERLRGPHVPDPRHELLPLKGLAERELGSAAKPFGKRGEFDGSGQDVGPETSDDVVAELEHGPIPLHRLELAPAQNEPRLAAHPRPTRLDAPAALHPKMASQHDAALEAEKHVLPDGVDALEHEAVEPRGDPENLAARVRRLGLDTLAHECPQRERGAMDAVALGHRRPG